MKLSLLLDMNIPPSWVPLLQEKGIPAIHWSDVGSPTAADEAVMGHARLHGQIIVTHDLDFTHLLALSHAAGPSVILLRRQSVLQEAVAEVIRAISYHESVLASGALMVIDALRSRVRILPIHHAED